MKRDFTLSIYGDATLKAEFDAVKEYYISKNPRIPMSDSAAGAKMINDTYNKIEGMQTNANRITTIIERLDSSEKTHAERLTALEMAVKELVDIIKGSQS